MGIATQLFDQQMIKDLAEKAVANRQQFTSTEQAVRIAGDLARRMGLERLVIRPDDLHGNYDYVPRTPTMVADPARLAQTWGGLLQMLMASPQMFQPVAGKRLNPHALFEEFVRTQGVNYMDKFYEVVPPQMQVVPDAQMQQMAQSGRAVPATEMPQPPVRGLPRPA